MVNRHEVCPIEELPPGEKTIVEIEGLPYSVGVFNVDGSFYAVANMCPHQLAPLCQGTITGEVTSDGPGDFQMIRDGEVIRCPWHGWKFNIEDGSSVFNPHKLGTLTYEVKVESKSDEQREQEAEYGTELAGDEPPVDTYDVDVEEEVVVVYV